MASKIKKVLILFISILIVIIVYIIVILFAPSGLLLDIDPKSHDYPLPESFTGPLEVNELLTNSVKLFEGQIDGPESMASFNQSIFTGSRNGYIYRFDIQNETLIPVIKLINNECQIWNQSLCGRPLGMRFDSNGVLYVVEPFFGIFRVRNIQTSQPDVDLILSYNQTDKLGKPSKFFDDLVIDENSGQNGGHVLYISDFSTEFDLTQYAFAMSGSQSGRILRYDINANEVDIICDHLLCPNGIELSDDKQFIIFAESGSRRILKHYIKGANTGQTMTLVDSLPGEPDNIRKTKNKTIWIALSFGRTQQNPQFNDWFDDKPLIKKLSYRNSHLMGSLTQYFGHLFNSNSIKNFGFQLKTGLTNFLVAKLLADSHGMVIEINESGQILRSLHSPDGTVTLLSEVNPIDHGNSTFLYLGSVYNNYIAKLKI